MIKSLSLMANVREICAWHRHNIFGEDASAKDYKDSYIINSCIESFIVNPEELVSDRITELDQAKGKVSKSVNLRADCNEKISTLSRLLNLSESEVIRRILYYTLENTNSTDDKKIRLGTLKEKLALLQTQIDGTIVTLKEIAWEIELLERKEPDT